jgi:hypothetical protein
MFIELEDSFLLFNKSEVCKLYYLFINIEVKTLQRDKSDGVLPFANYFAP